MDSKTCELYHLSILSVLDPVKQKGFYRYEYMSDFDKFKEDLPSK